MIRKIILNQIEIAPIINPWVASILKEKEKYKEFYKVYTSLDISDIKIQKFIFFNLLVYFYKPINSEEELFLKILNKSPFLKVNLINYIEDCEIFYMFCINE
jgi:hypothetical protein